MKAVHYAGAMLIVRKRSTTRILQGWAACCSGDKAIAIRKAGNNTMDKSKVTCRKCLRQIMVEEIGQKLYVEHP